MHRVPGGAYNLGLTMIRHFVMAALAMLTLAPEVSAEGRQVLGRGRLVTNDLLGDGKDRWQSGSVSGSHVVGRDWNGALPEQAFDLLEYRIGTQISAPNNLRRPKAGDRPFAGVLSLGLHTHFRHRQTEFSLGGDLAITGEQNGLSAFQTALHDGLGVKPASQRVLNGQVKNGFHPSLVAETGRSFAVGGQAIVRPFVETRVGLENIARIGADLTIGSLGQGELLIRDPVTGQRYRAIRNQTPGVSYVLGADVAHVGSSKIIPKSNGVIPEDTRHRVRAGMHWQGERNAVFYGLTYLSEEHKSQSEGQVVGSLRLNLKF